MEYCFDSPFFLFFFFQAEDGKRGKLVTGVQSFALPIWKERAMQGVRTGRKAPGAGSGGDRRAG